MQISEWENEFWHLMAERNYAMIIERITVDNVNSTDSLGYTLLGMCCTAPVCIKPSPELLKHIIDCGANVNGQQLLHYAVLWYDPVLVEILLRAGADVNEKVRGKTPLEELILHHTIQPDNTYITKKTLKCLMRYGGKTSTRNEWYNENGRFTKHQRDLKAWCDYYEVLLHVSAVERLHAASVVLFTVMRKNSVPRDLATHEVKRFMNTTRARPEWFDMCKTHGMKKRKTE